MRLSEHFTLEELIHSPTAIAHKIDNTPSVKQQIVLKEMCVNLLEPIRAKFGAIKVNSGYRNQLLNTKIGGATESDHMISYPHNVCAVDIDDAYLEVSNREVFKWIVENLSFHKIIWEFGEDSPSWIHISYSSDKKLNSQKLAYEAIKVKKGKNFSTVYKKFDRKLS